jgi:hypothetical protein
MCPQLFCYHQFGKDNYGQNVMLLLLTGAIVNAPYALITTAVSADLVRKGWRWGGRFVCQASGEPAWGLLGARLS